MSKISIFRVSGSVATHVFRFDTFKTRLNVSHCLFCVATLEHFRSFQDETSPKCDVNLKRMHSLLLNFNWLPFLTVKLYYKRGLWCRHERQQRWQSAWLCMAHATAQERSSSLFGSRCIIVHRRRCFCHRKRRQSWSTTITTRTHHHLLFARFEFQSSKVVATRGTVQISEKSSVSRLRFRTHWFFSVKTEFYRGHKRNA